MVPPLETRRSGTGDQGVRVIEWGWLSNRGHRPTARTDVPATASGPTSISQLACLPDETRANVVLLTGGPCPLTSMLAREPQEHNQLFEAHLRVLLTAASIATLEHERKAIQMSRVLVLKSHQGDKLTKRIVHCPPPCGGVSPDRAPESETSLPPPKPASLGVSSFHGILEDKVQSRPPSTALATNKGMISQGPLALATEKNLRTRRRQAARGEQHGSDVRGGAVFRDTASLVTSTGSSRVPFNPSLGMR